MIEPTQAEQVADFMGLNELAKPVDYSTQPVSEESRIEFERAMNIQETSELNLDAMDIQNGFGDEVTQRLFNGISGFDQEYRATMDKLQNYPSYKGYLEEAGLDPMSMDKQPEVTHISNITPTEVQESASTEDNVAAMLDKSVKEFEQQIARQSGYYTASLTYQQEATQWFLSTQFWASKVRVLTSAVSQLTNNVRTLFTSQ